MHVPQIGKRLEKGWIMRDKQGYDPYSWLRDQYNARVKEWAHIPILRKTLPAMKRVIDSRTVIPKTPTGYLDELNKGSLLWSKDNNIYEATELTFEQLSIIYDCDISMLKALETRLETKLSKDFVGSVFNDNFATHMYETEQNTCNSDF
jgi:hypothetical protein